jgi:hypothetical protein
MQIEITDLSKLTEFKSLGVNNKKTQIILSETKRNYKNYINSLKYRYNGKNPYLPNYVVTKNGEIYKILENYEYSNFMNNETIDKKSINIVLENFGWLRKNPLDDTYLNYVGDIYKGDTYEKKWRDFVYWDKYGEKQLLSLSELVKNICENMNIKKECVGTNVRYDEVVNYEGIVSKSNFDFIYKDINPSFDFKLLNKQLKNESI